MAENVYAKAFGTTLKYGNTGSTPATALAGVKAIRGLPNLNFDELDITRIDQADEMKHFAPSFGDPGTFQMTLGFDKANISTLYGMVKLLKSWLITFSDGSKLAFDGWIKQIGGTTAEVGNEVAVNVDVRVSGAHTFTPAP